MVFDSITSFFLFFVRTSGLRKRRGRNGSRRTVSIKYGGVMCGLCAHSRGTGGFLRLGAARCAARARRSATGRLVRFADPCSGSAERRPLASDQRERLPQFRAGARTGSRAVAAAERRQGQATNGSGLFSSARERELPVRQGPPSRPAVRTQARRQRLSDRTRRFRRYARTRRNRRGQEIHTGGRFPGPKSYTTNWA